MLNDHEQFVWCFSENEIDHQIENWCFAVKCSFQ